MNKYQKSLFHLNVYCAKAKNQLNYINTEDDYVQLTQNPDLSIDDYQIDLITGVEGTTVANLEWVIDGKKLRAEPIMETLSYMRGIRAHCLSPVFSFRDEKKRPSAVILYAINDLTEPLTVSFKYVNGNDEAYAKKVAEEKKRRDKEAIGLFVKTGQDVINVFFKLASEEVTESIVKVEAVIQMGHNLYQNFPVEENRLKSAVTFASYKDLAYGNYLITVKQLSKDGKTVAETSITTKIEPEHHGPVRPCNIIG